MSTSIILIRHGETAWNLERRLQGHTDIALNVEGVRQADALARALAGDRIDAVVASDLKRAYQTAFALAAPHGLCVALDAGLRERCYGGFEGMLYGDIAQRHPQQYASWQARDVDACLPPGRQPAESFRQFYDRALGTILALARQHVGRTVALVAHGGVLECAYRAAQGLPLCSARNFKVMNASINRFTVDGDTLRLLSWGEVGHLDQAALDEAVFDQATRDELTL